MIKNYSNWLEYEGASEGSGRSDKIWLKDLVSGEIGLFKFKKSEQTMENISEKLAEDIAHMIGIEAARTEIGSYQSRKGSMSYLINVDGEVLREGITLINRVYPAFDPETLYDFQNKEYYSVEMIDCALREYNLMDEFIKIMIFDFIIGNTDRHQSNWAVLQSGSKLRMSPVYDNGSSLCFNIFEDKIDSYLGKDKLRLKSLTNTKSKSRIRIDKEKKKEPTHLEVLRYLKQNYLEKYKLNSWITSCIEVMNCERIGDMLLFYMKNGLISKQRRQLLYIYLNEKIHLLKNEFYREEDKNVN